MNNYCDRCHEYIFGVLGAACSCQEFAVVCQEYDMKETVFAKEERDAALKFAKIFNDDNASLTDETILVNVGERKYLLYAESSIEYYCDEIKEGE